MIKTNGEMIKIKGLKLHGQSALSSRELCEFSADLPDAERLRLMHLFAATPVIQVELKRLHKALKLAPRNLSAEERRCLSTIKQLLDLMGGQ